MRVLLLPPLLLVACCVAAEQASQGLPGTTLLTQEGDLAQMVDGIHRFLDRETGVALRQRERFWKRDFGSAAAYEDSVAPNRGRLRRIIGAVDARVRPVVQRFEAREAGRAEIARRRGYRVYAVRWPVFEDVEGEGLLLQPDRAPVARIVAIPDADWSPEMLAGLVSGIPAQAQFARRLAESGCQVLVPALIDRRDTYSGVPGIRMTNQPHREWIYRMAFEVGRHIIGYEVQKILAAIDSLPKDAPVGVAGYGEGGLLAFHSAALDSRIQAALVSGYFQARREIWREPVYRDVWGLAREFGDAELAGLVAPRALVVEAALGPEIAGPPQETKERRNATPNGALSTPGLDLVREEVERARPIYSALHADARLRLVASGEGRGQPGSDAALAALLEFLGAKLPPAPPDAPAKDIPETLPLEERMPRQLNQLVAHTQRLVRESPRRRAEFWAKADATSPERWRESTRFYRDYIWDEVIGRLPPPSLPANPRTRLIFDEPRIRGYEVMLDVWPDVFAYGILIVPRNIQPGERRPVVVCQHGL